MLKSGKYNTRQSSGCLEEMKMTPLMEYFRPINLSFH